MHKLWTATRFLTRLPVRRTDAEGKADLGASAVWFPAVGAAIGLFVAGAYNALSDVDPWLAALCAVLVWLGITGAMHVDGAADLADALGARHRRPERFLTVLHDPHVGTFGVLAVLCIVLTKLISLHALTTHRSTTAALIMLPAWTRLGAVVWARALPPLTHGYGEALGAGSSVPMNVVWTGALLGAGSLFAPSALLVMAPLLAWWAFLRFRVGGVNGDAIGAGIEWCEAATLLLMAIWHGI